MKPTFLMLLVLTFMSIIFASCSEEEVNPTVSSTEKQGNGIHQQDGGF